MDKKQRTQIERIMRWRREYPGFWEIVCNSHKEDHIPLTAYQNMLEAIKKESVNELLFVFIETHKTNITMQGIFHDMFMEMVKERIDNKEYKKFMEKLIKKLD